MRLTPETLLAGKIRLVKRIGRGGMGDVWFARNEATQAELAVKTLLQSERTPTHDERFRREARLCATISHRNVVRVFDLLDEADGTLGLVMELLRGGTLEDVMRERGPLSAAQALSVALPVLSAMSHVHQKGIIHRDVKPANVFFAVDPDGHVIPKVLDFGIAKIPASGSALTVDGSVLGTPHYMSPEQIRGQLDIDGRSDMFSMAVVLYEMLTGLRLFQRDTAAASLAAVLEHEADPDGRIDSQLWLVLARALAKRPYERYATCAEFAEALRASVSATDDDLAQALQELRPTTTTFATDATDHSAALSADHVSLPVHRPLGRIVAAVIGVGVAFVTIGIVLAATAKPAATAHGVAPASAVPPKSVVTINVTAPSVPEPVPSSAPSAVASESPTPAPEPTPAPTPSLVVKRAGASSAAPKPKPRTSSVATTPGF